MTVKGNGGDLETHKKAYVENYREVWFDERAITNIMSLNNVKEKFIVTYDSDRDGTFPVHKTNGVNIKFGMHRNGLHYHDTVNRQVTMVQTVTENEKDYSKRQLTDAKTARELYAKVGYPLIKDLANMVKKNMIMNCPVTIEDVMRARKITGPSVQALKGKTIRTKPNPVVSDYVAVPHAIFEENRNVTLSVDVMFVNRIPFITSISRHLKFTTAETLHNRTTSQLVQCVTNLKALYAKRGFNVTTSLMVGEFLTMRTALLKMSVSLNTASASEHMPEIERQHRVIK